MNKTSYLFSFKQWHLDDYMYILIYAENESEARIIGCDKITYNNGKKPKPNDLKICTFGLS